MMMKLLLWVLVLEGFVRQDGLFLFVPLDMLLRFS